LLTKQQRSPSFLNYANESFGFLVLLVPLALTFVNMNLLLLSIDRILFWCLNFFFPLKRPTFASVLQNVVNVFAGSRMLFGVYLIHY
jgi:hypothetical protein